MMQITLTCNQCGSAVPVLPTEGAHQAQCEICQNLIPLQFNHHHFASMLKDCPCCQRKDFYRQKDFNRKIGVGLFILASILAFFTYGISFIVLYIFDFWLNRRLGEVAVCYKCQTVFRHLANMSQVPVFNHEMHDRIVYSNHDFHGKELTH